MELTHEQENLLKELRGDRTWISLLESIDKSREVKQWKPGDDEETKRAKWIFESGIQRGISDMVVILRLNKGANDA